MSPTDQATQIYSAPPDKRLATTNVAPPNSCYVSQDDTLYLFYVPSVTGAIIRTLIRLLSPEGDIKIMEYDFTTTGTRSPQIQTANLGEGFILSINVYCLTASLQRGQVYVRFAFLRGNITQAYLGQVLCQGYVTTNSSQFFPFGQNEQSVGGQGAIRSITGSTPAAGAEISETVPAGALWLLKSFSYTLLASATVATRQTTITIDDGTNVILRLLALAGQTAGTQFAYWFYDAAPYNATAPSQQYIPLPNLLMIPAGYRIRTLTYTIQAGDQYSAPQYLVEELMYP